MAKKAILKAAPVRQAATPTATANAFVDGKATAKRLTIDLPPETHSDFKVAAARAGISMVDLVREWITDYLAEPAPTKGKR